MHDHRKFKVTVNGRTGRTASLSERLRRYVTSNPASPTTRRRATPTTSPTWPRSWQAVRNALAGVACRRRQKQYESPQSRPVAAAQPQRLRAIAHREVGDERRGEVDGEAGVGPLIEPRRHRGKYQHHAEELGPRELHPEVGGEAEVGERLRHLRQEQLRVGGEAHLQAEWRGDDPNMTRAALRNSG